MASNFLKDDPSLGAIDLDDQYVTDAWLVDQFVGNEMRSWGYNAYGQLGDGTATSKSSPIQVGSLINWKQVSCNLSMQLYGIKTDGTLWACGYNGFGQLGDGTVTSKSSPIQVGLLTNWKQVISGGGYQNFGIKTDGTLWSWGRNNTGQLGDGTVVDKSSPVQVGALTNWKLIASGGYHNTAIKTDGTLWLWGLNAHGQLGDGTVVNKSSPVQVGALTNWKYAAAGWAHTIAIKTDGTLWSWGRNAYGQLGQNDTTNRSSPIQVGSLTNWKQVSCGLYYSAAIKTDGTLWQTISNSPVQVGALTNWRQVSVSTSGSHVAAIQSPDLP